ncbi:c-type cytochrome [Rhizobium sp. TRM96647]|uniref:di-heme oxidoreductase family protein n=1 Tax=unclassified Rhizobium TaxID=2613769 RepID=UPI0021E7FEAD|nr:MULTISPECIES: di-heme oxidoredictase family protein [unclassified Rhizobium]MCV3736519.1 c-type cytochrome [Rhizobium sp. TRM96647]MCV3758888.1 c-type cytochrome [Rhizobium sp. TRM96650]
MKRARSKSLLPALGGVLLLLAAGVAGSEPLPGSEGRTDLSDKDRARVEAVTRPTTDFSRAEQYEAMSGGAATSTAAVNADSFSHFSENLTFQQEEGFKLGNALFRKVWVSSPSSTQASDGLGPLFNSRACQNCHLKDGRGHPPQAGDDTSTTFLRLARPPANEAEQERLDALAVPNFPDPVYGGQLQDFAVPGLAAEGRMRVEWSEEPVRLAGGETVFLRRPRYSVGELAYGAMDPGTTISPRMTPPMIGLGLVEAIHEADIMALADPEDADGDGISGKAALVRDPETGRLALGRFGWKAQNATVRRQTAEAFANDIGISNPLAPASHGDCTAAQTACLVMPDGVQKRLGDTEAPDPVLDLVTFYAENLAVPARRKASFKETLAGKKLFYGTGCTACHTPKFVTRRDARDKAQSFQLIWPYSDFLLHDMGEGLADGQPVGLADGREWRTPPLWGIGLTETVSGHTFFLHDGRARNLTEAILWHGGEAQAARDRFSDLEAADRAALLTFLESL